MKKQLFTYHTGPHELNYAPITILQTRTRLDDFHVCERGRSYLATPFIPSTLARATAVNQRHHGRRYRVRDREVSELCRVIVAAHSVHALSVTHA